MKRHDLHFIHIGHDLALYCSACRCRLTDDEAALAWGDFERQGGATQNQAVEFAAVHDASFIRRLSEIVKNALYGIGHRPRCVVIA